MLGIEDHGIFTCWIQLDYGSAGQAFGGYAMDTPMFEDPEKMSGFKGRVGTAWGMEFISKLLATVGVESWEKLPGTHVRVDCDHGKVYRIGHVLKDKWFDPTVDLEHVKE